ncbi:AAA family ATPase, partial [Vibrio owensii]
QAKKEFYLASQQKAYIKKLKDIYESEKKRYLESIVKEIEILFHIYSGRLMQSYQQGLGIFIENDGNSISFNQTPGEDFDVVFSMSSGQLSALVLSFTLALNQRYAKNGLLLIDDPVQTLDEINVAGFIELLRTEFSDRQVILSTHEDRVSAYFRYKYKKFGFEPSRINFMDLSKTDYIDEN